MPNTGNTSNNSLTTGFRPALCAPANKLYLITNDDDCPTETVLLRKISAALEAGIKWIQFRTKPGGAFDNPDHIRETAGKLQRLCAQASARLFMNDHVDIASLYGIDLHIGQTDTPIESAKTQLGPQAYIGLTCHASLRLAQEAVRQGADYISFGAFFPSKTKPMASIAPPSILRQARSLNIPIVAIGGIAPHNASGILASGADVVAVSHAILGKTDIGSTCQRFIEATNV